MSGLLVNRVFPSAVSIGLLVHRAYQRVKYSPGNTSIRKCLRRLSHSTSSLPCVLVRAEASTWFLHDVVSHFATEGC